MAITVNFGDKVKWGASSRWSLLPNSAWSIIETRTITKTHPTLDIGHFHDLFSEKAKEIICAEEKNKEASRAQTCWTRSRSRHWKPSRESIGLGNKTNLYWCQRPGLISTVGYVFPMVVFSILPHPEIGRNHHQGYASYFTTNLAKSGSHRKWPMFEQSAMFAVKHRPLLT